MSTPTLAPPERRARGRRGTGHLYPRGAVRWAQYFVNGRRVQQSTGPSRKGEAAEFLQKRLGQAAEGRPILPRVGATRLPGNGDRGPVRSSEPHR